MLNLGPIWDTIIVGGGPAGLSAALVLARARRRVLICDGGQPRNRSSNRIGGFLTRDGVDPSAFLELARNELGAYDTVDFLHSQITSAASGQVGFELQTSSGDTLIGRKVLIATGVIDRLPPVPQIDEFYGRTVWHCPYCDGYEHRDQRVAIYGSGSPALALALELTGWTSHLTVVSDGPCRLSAGRRQRLENNGIEIREDPVVGLEGTEGRLTHIVFASNTRLATDAMFFPSLGQADLDLATGLGVRTTRNWDDPDPRIREDRRTRCVHCGGCLPTRSIGDRRRWRRRRCCVCNQHRAAKGGPHLAFGRRQSSQLDSKKNLISFSH